MCVDYLVLFKIIALALPAGALLAEPAAFRAISVVLVTRLFALSWRHRRMGIEPLAAQPHVVQSA